MLLRQDRSLKVGIANKRLAAAWNKDYLVPAHRPQAKPFRCNRPGQSGCQGDSDGGTVSLSLSLVRPPSASPGHKGVPEWFPGTAMTGATSASREPRSGYM